MVQDYDDDIIELTEVFTEESSPKDQDLIELTQEPPDSEALLSEDISLARKDGEDIMPSLDRGELEAVLEKVIEKKFSGIIEKILFEVMEKVIKREIEDIKAGLKKDLDDIG
ncbi:hypothetical protein [Desulfobacter latus]|uniref:Uncharacterized protein n=1 Tax=Desulfobacter latus TaxID=2292 RepID=A0A850T7K8_9BACT|nr:hypothetical protein [Desulfobacter latus]NWH05065.1 hypothetical protein [Desulfobacter latus]